MFEFLKKLIGNNESEPTLSLSQSQQPILNHYQIMSKEKGWPYLCDTEEEYDLLASQTDLPFKGGMKAILSLIFSYQYGGYIAKNETKANYWRNFVRAKAGSGDYVAQAALITNQSKRLFPEDEYLANKAKYEEKIWQAAKEGNKYAEYAVGLFLTEYGDPDTIMWLTLAGEQGLTDAYYDIAMNALDAKYYSKDQNQLATFAEKFKYFKLAAECDNGIFAGYCQDVLADAYVEGQYIERDKRKAEYWYRKAIMNGSVSSEYSLKLLLENKL